MKGRHKVTHIQRVAVIVMPLPPIPGVPDIVPRTESPTNQHRVVRVGDVRVL